MEEIFERALVRNGVKLVVGLGLLFAGTAIRTAWRKYKPEGWSDHPGKELGQTKVPGGIWIVVIIVILVITTLAYVISKRPTGRLVCFADSAVFCTLRE